MNRREAKRRACHHAALVIEDALGAGWPFNGSEDAYLDEYGDPTPDGNRVADALADIVEELHRRASGCSP